MIRPLLILMLSIPLLDEPSVETPEPKPAAEAQEVAPAKVDKPASETDKNSEEKKPIRLRRDRAESKRKGNDAKESKPADEEKAPPTQDRNIPGPEDKEPVSELDRDLLGELGQDLEKGEAEQTDPLLRAGKRMRDVETQLARNSVGDETIEVQDKIIADLDELLKQQQNGNPPPNQNKNKKPQKKNQQQQQSQMQQQQQAKQQANNQRATDAADRVGPARSGKEEFGTPKETKDVWGHLNEMLREEMSQYAKEGFLEKYRDLLEQYYSTIAARSQTRSE